jgi:preprotein translocase subunit SecG
MFSVLLGIQVLVSVAIISLVMLQQGKGADMGAAFGSGASGTVFGSRGSGSFFTRATGILAAVFFVNCLLIASPLVRETTRPETTLADQLEQQAVQQEEAADNAAQQAVPAVAPEDMPPQLEQAATPEDMPPQAEQAATPEDMPAVPADKSGAPAADDLPQ